MLQCGSPYRIGLAAALLTLCDSGSRARLRLMIRGQNIANHRFGSAASPSESRAHCMEKLDPQQVGVEHAKNDGEARASGNPAAT